jgi:uncharacterized protein YbjT (DUF2867 family)
MPSFLVVGATGNTGGAVLQHLAEVLPQSDKFSKYRIIGLTRDTNGTKAQELEKLPRVEMIAKDWTLIDSDWLREYEVERLYIASHIGVSAFTDESLFFNYALEAGVKYAVKLSTTATNVRPTTPVYYARNHWAVEKMLEQPEFNALQWTSLQPNVFISTLAGPARDWISTYKKDGTKKPYQMIPDADAVIAPIDSNEVGVIAGKLLALEDVTPHASRKYCLNGPQNASGKDIIKVVEKCAGTTVDNVTYRSTFIVDFARKAGTPENVLGPLGKAVKTRPKDEGSVENMPTSAAVFQLHTIKNGVLDTLEKQLSMV